MTAPHASVSRFVAELRHGGHPFPVLVELSWSARDPYVLYALFTPHGGQPVEWLLGRDLVSTGLYVPFGDGDVHVHPEHHGARRITVLTLVTPGGEAELGLPTDELLAFLRSTYDVVPTGAEWLFADLDSELALLLEGS